MFQSVELHVFRNTLSKISISRGRWEVLCVEAQADRQRSQCGMIQYLFLFVSIRTGIEFGVQDHFVTSNRSYETNGSSQEKSVTIHDVITTFICYQTFWIYRWQSFVFVSSLLDHSATSKISFDLLRNFSLGRPQMSFNIVN